MLDLFLIKDLIIWKAEYQRGGEREERDRRKVREDRVRGPPLIQFLNGGDSQVLARWKPRARNCILVLHMCSKDLHPWAGTPSWSCSWVAGICIYCFSRNINRELGWKQSHYSYTRSWHCPRWLAPQHWPMLIDFQSAWNVCQVLVLCI